MTGVAIGFSFFFAYVALVVVIVRWARRRLFQRAEATAAVLKASGAKILAVKPSPRWRAPAVVDFELDGKRGSFHVRRYGRDSPSATASTCPPTASARRASSSPSIRSIRPRSPPPCGR